MASQNINVNIAGQSYQVAVSVGSGVPNPTGIFSAKAYGAVGNGTTNDATAIQAAVNAAEAASGGVVLLPAGTFAIGSAIVVDSDKVTICGLGVGATIIKPTAGTANIHGIVLDNVKQCTVRDCTITGFVSSGAAQFAGIAVWGGSRNTIINNEILGCDDAGISIGYDIYGYFDLTAEQKLVPGTVDEGEYHIISGNRIENTVQGCGIELIRAEHAVCTDNIIINPDTHGIRVLGAYDCVVSNNVCIGGDDGISLQAYGDAEPVGVTKLCKRVVVSGNNITATTGIDGRVGLEDVRICDNVLTVTSLNGSGISLNWAAGTTIADHNMVNVEVENNHTIGGAFGVYIGATCNGLRVRGNTLTDFDWAGIWGETETSEGEILKLEIRGNRFVTGAGVPSREVKYGIKLYGPDIHPVIGGNVYDTSDYNHAGAYQFIPYKPDADVLVTGRLDPVSVADFGAVGDHVVDDSIDINYAISFIAEAGSGDLYFPSGYYLCPDIDSITTADIVATGFPPVELVGGGPRVLRGTGTPEAAVTAPIGSIYMRTNGGANTSLYVKESGAGNTGWVAK